MTKNITTIDPAGHEMILPEGGAGLDELQSKMILPMLERGENRYVILESITECTTGIVRWLRRNHPQSFVKFYNNWPIWILQSAKCNDDYNSAIHSKILKLSETGQTRQNLMNKLTDRFDLSEENTDDLVEVDYESGDSILSRGIRIPGVRICSYGQYVTNMGLDTLKSYHYLMENVSFKSRKNGVLLEFN